ncbi:MAG TPA: DEAD/DEAH box helicase [Nitriliruptoraceae bacterium]|nr:DEAD/DEAH box helicase [Nitriliruptoraceae bacterium]
MRRLRLRRWQKEALDAFEHRDRADFLAVATPGAGKTTFALTALVRDLATHPHRRVVIVAPTSHLKQQWVAAATSFGLHLEDSWRPERGWPHDFHGTVVTYQQVASASVAIAHHTLDAAVVFDEIHHAGADRAWGDAVGTAFGHAAWRLGLSGTPFRSDQNPIPFVTYEFDEAVADHTYDYGEALEEGGVVRPVFFPAFNGHMEWTTPEGFDVAATFDDELDRTLSSQRLRTALSLDSDWLPTVLAQADEHLQRLRATDPRAGGLVIATDVDHAHGIADVIRRRLGRGVEVATSDDPTASARIADFAAGDDDWIVAVRMVSEGVDIPRLRVGVWATTTVTELFFRQAVGRVVRWTPGMRRQKAFFFLPDDRRLRAHAATIAQHRTHSLRRRVDDGLQDEVALDEVATDPGDQMSLFAAISATPLGDERPDVAGVFDDTAGEDLIHDADLLASAGVDIDLLPPPRRSASDDPTDEAGIPLTVVREELRAACNDRVQVLVNLTGMGHREINSELNRAAAIDSVDTASVTQLRSRLSAADRWLASA